MWQSFLQVFKGRSFFLNDAWLNSSTLNLYTDASGSLGYGAIFGNFWCYGSWPDDWKSFNITILEFYPIVISVLLWGDLMRKQRIIFFTDNPALVDIINKLTSRDTTIMVLVRKLVLTCLQYNILFRAQHVQASIMNLLTPCLDYR